MQSKTARSWLQRISLLFMVFVMLFSMNMPLVVSAYAADAHTYYIQMAVDTSNWSFVGAVVNDKDGMVGNYTEVERIGSDVLQTMLASSPSDQISGMLGSVPSTGGGSNKNYKVLSFPGFSTDAGFTTPQASAAQADRATFIKDRLIYDLNTAIRQVYQDKEWNSLDDFRGDVQSILSAVENAAGGGTGQISYNGLTWTFSQNTNSELADPKNGIKSNYYIVMKSSEGDQYTLLVAIDKYLDSMSESDKPQNPGVDDTELVTWGMMAYEAFVNSTLEKNAVTADTVYNATAQGVLESAVTALFSNLLNGLRSLLGLWDLDSLIFNAGVRGSSSYVAGIFPASWETFIWTIFLIAEILSVAIIMAAIGKNILSRASATVNPLVRANMMEQIKDMAIAVILLVLLPVIIIGLMQLSASLTGVFASFLPEGKSLQEEIGHFSTGNSLAALVVGLANLVISIYFNWFYIIRSITVALLICMAPVFISMMALGGQTRSSMAQRWLMELLSNIFIQPIHAMMFSFIVLMPKTGRAIESLVFLYCMIPLTALLKNLFFQGTSDMIHRSSNRAGLVAGALGAKSLGAVAGGAVGAAKGAVGAVGEAKTGRSGTDNGSGNDSIRPNGKVSDGAAASTPQSPQMQTKAAINKGAGAVVDKAGAAIGAVGTAAAGAVGSAVGAVSSGMTEGVAAGGTGGFMSRAVNAINSIGAKTAAGAAMLGTAIAGQGKKFAGSFSGGAAVEEEYGPENMISGPVEFIEDEDTVPGQAVQGGGEPSPAAAMADQLKTAYQENASAAGTNGTMATGMRQGPDDWKLRAKTAWAGMRMVGASTMIGMSHGWRGQIFGGSYTPEQRRRMEDRRAGVRDASAAEQRNRDARFSEQAFAERQGQMSQMFASYNPGRGFDVETTDAESFGGIQVGAENRLSAQGLEDNGFSHIQRDEDGLSYDVDLAKAPEPVRQSLLDAVSTEEGQRLAAEQGYTITPHMQNGVPTGVFAVSVKDNPVTGQRAPRYNKDTGEIVSGGENYQDVVPNMKRMSEHHEDAAAAAGYDQQRAAYGSSMRDYQAGMQEAIAPIQAEEQMAIRSVGARAAMLDQNYNAVRENHAELQDAGIRDHNRSSAISMGGYEDGSIQVEGGKTARSYTVTHTEMARRGVTEMQISEDGRTASYAVSQNTTVPELSQVLTARNAAKQADASLVERGEQAHYLKDFENAYASGSGGVTTTFQDRGEQVVVTQRVKESAPEHVTFAREVSDTGFTATSASAPITPQYVETGTPPPPPTVGSHEYFRESGKGRMNIVQQQRTAIHQGYEQQITQARDTYRATHPEPVEPVISAQAQHGMDLRAKAASRAERRSARIDRQPDAFGVTEPRQADAFGMGERMRSDMPGAGQQRQVFGQDHIRPDNKKFDPTDL